MPKKQYFMKVSDPIIIKAALKVYSEKLRGFENQSIATEYTLERVQYLRQKEITSDSSEIKIKLS